jgi:hypothetical protein
MLLIEKLSREIVLTIMRATEKPGQVQEACAVFLKAKIVCGCVSVIGSDGAGGRMATTVVSQGKDKQHI